jgi:hypothetical protein
MKAILFGKFLSAAEKKDIKGGTVPIGGSGGAKKWRCTRPGGVVTTTCVTIGSEALCGITSSCTFVSFCTNPVVCDL